MIVDIETLISIIVGLLTLLNAPTWILRRGRRGKAWREYEVESAWNVLEALKAEVWPVVHLEVFLAVEEMARLRLDFKARIAVHEEELIRSGVLERPVGLGEALEKLLALPYPPAGAQDVTPHEVGLRAVMQFEAARGLMEAIDKVRRELDGYRPVG